MILNDIFGSGVSSEVSFKQCIRVIYNG